ncbi:hypothetical protein HK096_009433, partial [Nowakowskiella sp. JEL0078]
MSTNNISSSDSDDSDSSEFRNSNASSCDAVDSDVDAKTTTRKRPRVVPASPPNKKSRENKLKGKIVNANSDFLNPDSSQILPVCETHWPTMLKNINPSEHSLEEIYKNAVTAELSNSEITTLFDNSISISESCKKYFQFEENEFNLFSKISETGFGKLELQKLAWRFRHIWNQSQRIELIEKMLETFLESTSNVKKPVINSSKKSSMSNLKSIKFLVAAFCCLAPSSLAIYLVNKFQKVLKSALESADNLSNTICLLKVAKEKRTTTGKREKNPRYIAEILVNDPRIKVTGARIGETIIGFGLSGGTQMEILDCDVPPILQDVMLINSFPDLWENFLTKIGQDIEFFRSLPDNYTRGKWILDSAEPEDLLHMMDMNSLKFRVLNLGKNDNIEKLSEAERTLVMTCDSISCIEFSELFPTKVGSQTLGGHQTLFFGRAYWRVLPRDPQIESVPKETLIIQISRFDELAIMKGPLIRNPCESLVEILFLEDMEAPCACLFNERGAHLHFPTLIKHFGIKDDIYESWKKATKNFTAAAFKSLLQKIIRFRPANISTPSIVAARDALVITFLQLLTHPGGFVPDIQRYVSGVESALKRLAIIAFEDAYPSDSRVLAELMVATFISQRYKTWKPTMEQLERWVAFLLSLLMEPRYVEYDISRGSKVKKITIAQAQEETNPTVSHFMAVSALLEIVRSFEGDLNMVRDMATFPISKWKIHKIQTDPKGTMPLQHCVDQHWAPDVVYFFRPLDWLYEECLKDKTQKASTPFAGLLKRLFSDVTGVNPRREAVKSKDADFDNKHFESQDFVWHARAAQKSYLDALQIGKDISMMPSKFDDSMQALQIEFKAELENAWLSGMLGTLEVQKGKLLASLIPDDISRSIVAKRPAVRKSMKATTLKSGSEIPVLTAQSAAIAAGISEDATTLAGDEEFWNRLQNENGLEMTAIPSFPFKELKGAAVRYDGQDFWIHYPDGRKILWEVARFSKISLPLHPKFNDLEENPEFDYIDFFIKNNGDGICENAEEMFESIVQPILLRIPGAGRRLLAYLQRNSPEFEINRISRNGGGNDAAVILDDAGAFHLLVLICVLYPGVVSRVNGRANKFEVRCAPKMWEIRERLQKLIVEVLDQKTTQNLETGIGWGELQDTKRTMIKYQEELTSELVAANKKGRRGSFLWLPPGSGKTKIICEFLSRLAQSGDLPPYIVYCLPKESLQTIADELEIYGFRYRILVPHALSAKRYADDISAEIDISSDEESLNEAESSNSKKGQKRTLADKKEKSRKKTKKLISKKASNSRSFVVDFPASTKPVKIQNILKSNGGHVISSGGLKDQFWVHIVEHDHLRVLVSETLLPSSGETMFIIDEVHLAMSESTQRTASAQALADACRGFVALTGTPIIDSNMYRLIAWLRYLVPFTVTERNLWSAATNMVARKVEATGIARIYELVDATFSTEEELEWKKLMPPRIGGTNRMAGNREFTMAAELSYKAVTRELISQARILLNSRKRRGIMLVARNAKHGRELFDEIKRSKLVSPKQLLLMIGVSSLTRSKSGGYEEDENLSQGESNIVSSTNLTPTNNTKNIKIVIVPYRRATGYTLTALDTLLWT